MASGNPSIDALLARATFTPLHQGWLPERAARLEARFRSLTVARPVSVLLLNATKGQQLYPSIVDFFALLQRVQPRVRVTSASHFAEVFDLERGVRAKGLTVAPMREVTGWSVAEVNRFDVVIAVGPSQTLARLMAMPGLRARLVCLDLAFYHQLIDASGGAFTRGERVVTTPMAAQANRVVAYSCQPAHKIADDLRRAGFALDRFAWRWFDYIPAGLAYGRYYRADAPAFDVALTGTSGRDYAALEPEALRGRRLLFLGAVEQAPALLRLRSELDLTVVPRVDEDDYARLLSLCRCVVLPLVVPRPPPGRPRGSGEGTNVFLSVVDALASGTPLVTTPHEGLARLERSRAPLVVIEPGGPRSVLLARLLRAPSALSAGVDALLRDDARRRDLAARSVAFAREHLDIYAVLARILFEQVL
jgi:hypothetical protein